METVNKKKVLADALKMLDIMGDKDTGQIICHMNDGGITKIVVQREVK